MLRKILIGLLLSATFLSLFFASWYVSHGDIHFYTDIARDFLLLEELDAKKLILIGPRSSVGGLYHGTLWLYLNYPSFILGGGNPIVVGWFWILLIVAFLISSFFMARKLFSETVAYVYVALVSGYLIYHAKELLNPHGAFFVIPFFFFTFVRYIQTKKLSFLFFHYVLLGMIIHFQISVGAPLLLLSFPATFFFIVKHKLFKHVVGYLGLILLLSNYILYEIKYHFPLSRVVLTYISPVGNDSPVSYITLFQNRFDLFTSLQFVTDGTLRVNQVMFLVFFVLLFLAIKAKKQKEVYLSFLYFYTGYYLFSFLSKYPIMSHQFYPLFSLLLLILASFIQNSARKVAILFCFVVIVLNVYKGFLIPKQADTFIGKHEDSWIALKENGEKIFAKDKEFGYFIYSPDAYGYEGRYLMHYMQQIHPDVTSHSFQKKDITYFLITPPPPDKPYMSHVWWKENQVKLEKPPVETLKFPNGYLLEKYHLTKEEQSIPFDPAIDTGIHFR